MIMKGRRAMHIAIMFFVAGGWGAWVSSVTGSSFILYLAVINIVLGIIFIAYYARGRSTGRKDSR
ncbi:MAG: hypothetical protein RMJ59_05020 [Candidatus Nitrosocaldus sp.]|nr:hypothetical protein [Candidatus Nitrosocaldus sp.]MCS7141373.1 hypothetical protein [Candidatus Nitrosocaldus sp.]MDW8000735.1 hypothetical protein [Candidatus Nitrosocaldus sp.]MDW8275724.1 hypothetical protein [Candidatus Nitrosocaldus sp.]